MKHIFVTVEEFLANGGVLDTERFLYNDKLVLIGFYDGEFEDSRFEDSVRVKNSTGTFPIYKSMANVEIECTPIYK